jgi:hypothetical protein
MVFEAQDTLDNIAIVHVRDIEKVMDAEGLEYGGINMFTDRALEASLQKLVQGKPLDELLRIIRDAKWVPYLSKLLEDGMEMCAITKARKTFAETSKDIHIPDDEKADPINYVTRLVREDNAARRALKQSFKAVLELRGTIQQAMAQHALDGESLKGLHLKMEALDQHFYDAGFFLGHDPPEPTLIWLGEQWW